MSPEIDRALGDLVIDRPSRLDVELLGRARRLA